MADRLSPESETALDDIARLMTEHQYEADVAALDAAKDDR